jgi:hypothetical protein
MRLAEGLETMRPSLTEKVGVVPYDDSAGLDAILSDAVDLLRAQGTTVAGLLQRFGEIMPSGKQSMWVEDIRSGQAIRLDQPRGPGAIACTFDTDALARAAFMLRIAVESGADLIVVSRFGSAEAEGGGLRAEIAEAICGGAAVLIPVRNSLLPALEEFLGATATLLQASVEAIADWAESRAAVLTP